MEASAPSSAFHPARSPPTALSFISFECLGSSTPPRCMMVDEEYHENLTPERARQIVKECRSMAFEPVLTQNLKNRKPRPFRRLQEGRRLRGA